MPKVVDHEAYRSELLRDSFEIVASIGYGSLSMKQLARSLKISPGLIYHYFVSKEDWFVSLVVHFSKETFDRLSREINVDAGLEEKTESLVAEIARHRDLYANMIGVASDFARMPKMSSGDGMFQIGIAVSHLYQHVAMLFETDEATARALVAYLAGVILAGRLDPQGVNTGECLPVIRRILETPELEGGASC